MKRIVILTLSALITSTLASPKIATNSESPTWWKTSVYYQIYIRSFKDSNNDGIGDIQGIISKLNYLRKTGVTAICLSSIFKSPLNDQDISDYNSIDPDYGSDEDFRQLLEEANIHDIKVILDLVPNHTSDQHEWFKKSVAKDVYYTDFYVWHDGILSENSTRLPPNNWISVFGSSAWEWNEERQQFYLHQFGSNQPDLNYRNLEVLRAMDSVLINWLDKGVAGFKLNAINFLYEADDFKDEPIALEHIYTVDQDATYTMVYRWRKMLDNYGADYDTRILLTEANTTPEKTFLYYGLPDGSRAGAHFSFNFDFITSLNKNSTAIDVKKIIDKWTTQLPESYTPNWALGNHEHSRAGTRLGKDRIDGFNMLVTFLPGIQTIYYGEEIGMLNVNIPCEAAAKNCVSRDFERTPFLWDNSTNAGFNKGHKTWLPVSKSYLTTNLAKQNTEACSHYSIFQSNLEYRETYQKTTPMVVNVLDEKVLEIVRGTDCGEFVFLFNLSNNVEIVDVLKGGNEKYTVHYLTAQSQYRLGDNISRYNVTLVEGEGLMLRAACSDLNK